MRMLRTPCGISNGNMHLRWFKYITPQVKSQYKTFTVLTHYYFLSPVFCCGFFAFFQPIPVIVYSIVYHLHMLFVSSMLFLHTTTEAKIGTYWEDIHTLATFTLSVCWEYSGEDSCPFLDMAATLGKIWPLITAPLVETTSLQIYRLVYLSVLNLFWLITSFVETDKLLQLT